MYFPFMIVCNVFTLFIIQEHLPFDLYMNDKDLKNTVNSTISVSVISQSPQEPKIGIKQINNSLAHLTSSGCFDYDVRTGDLLYLHQWAAPCTYTHRLINKIYKQPIFIYVSENKDVSSHHSSKRSWETAPFLHGYCYLEYCRLKHKSTKVQEKRGTNFSSHYYYCRCFQGWHNVEVFCLFSTMPGWMNQPSLTMCWELQWMIKISLKLLVGVQNIFLSKGTRKIPIKLRPTRPLMKVFWVSSRWVCFSHAKFCKWDSHHF